MSAYSESRVCPPSRPVVSVCTPSAGVRSEESAVGKVLGEDWSGDQEVEGGRG